MEQILIRGTNKILVQMNKMFIVNYTLGQFPAKRAFFNIDDAREFYFTGK